MQRGTSLEKCVVNLFNKFSEYGFHVIVDEGEVPFFRQEPGVAIRDQFCMAVAM